MAVNWVMLAPSGQDLLPLAGEKTFLTVQAVDISIKPINGTGNTNKASGKILITNKRIAFIAKNAAALPDPQNTNALRTLTCPLSHFLDGRFVQPWLAANYYEAHIKPVANGGLTTPQQIKIDFKEGGGFDFTNAVEEVKSRFCEAPAAEAESLPVYSASNNDQPIILPSQSTSTNGTATPQQNTSRANSMPSDADIQAATTARDEEAAEVEAAETQQGPPPDGPPDYRP